MTKTTPVKSFTCPSCGHDEFVRTKKVIVLLGVSRMVPVFTLTAKSIPEVTYKCNKCKAEVYLPKEAGSDLGR